MDYYETILNGFWIILNNMGNAHIIISSVKEYIIYKSDYRCLVNWNDELIPSVENT